MQKTKENIAVDNDKLTGGFFYNFKLLPDKTLKIPFDREKYLKDEEYKKKYK